jgi:RNA polymerase sigma-70 factor, ECF subfamily
MSSDGELLDRWRAGDSASGEALFERYYDLIERFFINKVASAVTDLVQETFARCVESRERIRDGEQFRLYLFGIAYRVLTGYLRDRYRAGPPVDVEETSLHDLAPGAPSQLADRDARRLLLEALRTVPIGDQVVIELHYWESLTTEEIAAALSIPVGTVRGRLQRARTKLAEVMHRLTESPRDLAATASQLEDWATACRAQLGRG